MKTLGIVIVLLLFSPLAFAQHWVLAVHTEYTVAGFQHGGTLAYETAALWAAGIFYQSRLAQVSEESRHSLYGVHFQLPIVRSERISFLGTLRGGIADKKFVALLPGLETRINLYRRLAVGMGMNLRMNYPSLSLRIILRLNH